MFHRWCKKKSAVVSAEDLFKAALGKIAAQERIVGDTVGVQTGFRTLDTITAGFQPGNLIACLGRPSMGKTAFALTIAAQVAHQKCPVLYLALEESKERIALRLICLKGQVSVFNARHGFLDDTDWPKLAAGAVALSETPIYVDDRVKTIRDIEKVVREHVPKYGIKLVLIDSLQRIDDLYAQSGGARQRGYDQVCRRLKHMAVRNKVPVFLTCWLSKRVEDKYRRTLLLSQIAQEEGNLGFNADVVMQVYREEYYEPTPENTDHAAIQILKSGNYENGSLPMRFRRDGCFFDIP
jgi:replicative DNA helicase